ncbi:hypothetical protein M0P98_03925 [bacterium]|nr:hypothetical protein [bacterium]
MENKEPDELKILLKGKSPSEIAEIVENYYNAKYEEEKIFTGRNLLVPIIFFIVLIILLVIFYKLLALSSAQKKDQPINHFNKTLEEKYSYVD